MGSSKRSKDKDRKKKKKDRSRSREREKHSRHHHKHKKHKRTREELSPSISLSDLSDFEPEFSEIPIRKRNTEDHDHQPPAKLQRKEATPEQFHGNKEENKSGSGKEASLSIEDTNKIRAKLGLKLLESGPEPVSDKDKPEEGSDYKAGEEVHRPPENLRDKIQVEKLREKIAAQREKRRLKGKLTSIKTLGQSDDEDDVGAKSWVHKSRKIDKERKEAEKKNKILEELDAQFGVGDLIEEELHTKKRRGYTSNHLSGLKVQHDTERFADGRTTILTLKDSNVLDEEEDTLQNVDLVDLERAEKNVKMRKTKPGEEMDYEAPDVDEFGNIVQKELLTKYDEEIVGERKQSFRIGNRGQGAFVEKGEKAPMTAEQHKNKLNKLRQLTSLITPNHQLATEYLTPSEMTPFKKFKKKKRKKKMLTADDLMPLENEESHRGSRSNPLSRATEEGELPVVGKRERIKTLRELMEEDDEEDSYRKREVPSHLEEPEEESDNDAIELQEALARSRRAKLLNRAHIKHSAEVIGDTLASVPPIDPLGSVQTMDVDEEEEENKMTLNLTDEFCRSLGDIPTYGLSGNRAEDDAVQSGLAASPPKGNAHEGWGDATGTWEEVDIEETKVEIENDKCLPILEEEPDTARGVVNALKLAVKKGYLEKGSNNKAGNTGLQHLKAIHYSIEDKTMDDDRRSRNNDRYMGPTIDFKEKETYKPDVKLEYVDDEGRKLNAKEAFRYLSHKFHGKGSGKNKLEKRMKKWQEELLMKTMSSSDTPLQTLERQREKQKQLGAAFLVLSGSKPQESLEVKK